MPRSSATTRPTRPQNRRTRDTSRRPAQSRRGRSGRRTGACAPRRSAHPAGIPEPGTQFGLGVDGPGPHMRRQRAVRARRAPQPFSGETPGLVGRRSEHADEKDGLHLLRLAPVANRTSKRLPGAGVSHCAASQAVSCSAQALAALIPRQVGVALRGVDLALGRQVDARPHPASRAVVRAQERAAREGIHGPAHRIDSLMRHRHRSSGLPRVGVAKAACAGAGDGGGIMMEPGTREAS